MAESHHDSFASLLEPNLCTNTSAFLSVYRDGITQSTNPFTALTRFKVEFVSVNKTEGVYEHEYISVVVRDGETEKLHDFFIERQASQAPAVPATDSPSTDSLVSTDSPDIPESIPLLRIHDSPHSSSDLFLPSTPSPRPPPKRAASPYSLGQRVTLGSAKLLNLSASSLEVYAAEDRIMGEGMVINNSSFPRLGKPVCETQTYNLCLFELGILADVVHCEAPNYKILANQCYWFANTIYNVVRTLFQAGVEQSNTERVNFLPPLAGHWKNFMIVGTDLKMIEGVIEKILQRREAEFSKVSFH
jgi:hypothetical protein